ncbi:mandelate racemase/muconate lactonizing enzyme family protein [soil metagenome]
MSKLSDVRIETVSLTFHNEHLTVPLHLSRGAITEVTYAKVVINVRTRAGQTSQGVGAILLSDLWAFPHPVYTHAQKDQAMRALCTAISASVQGNDDYSDPLEKGHHLEQALPALMRDVEQKLAFLEAGDIPRLAALNCLSPFDAAVHDAWGRALGGSAYNFYAVDWLNADLGVYLGNEFAGRYPIEFLGQRRQTLGIQHVVGMSDALTLDGRAGTDQAVIELPPDLASWIKRDGINAFKVKSRGQDPLADARRLSVIYATGLAAGLAPNQIHLSIDPNEACASPDFLLEMMDCMAMESPAALAALDYIEQPTARDLSTYTFTLHQVAQRKPVIIDESLDRLENLALLKPLGWSGLAVKTCKGQTHSLLAYCWGKQHKLFMTIQDLTNPGLALVHSANLCAQLDLAVSYFECNSRQFMPHACPEEQKEHPAYFHAYDGSLHLPRHEPMGLY